MLIKIKTYLLNNKLSALLLIIALVAVSSAVWNWYHPQIKTLTKTEYQTVEKEKIVEKIRTIRVPGPKEVVTIEKKVIVEKLGIAPVSDDEEIIGNADVEPSEGGTSVIAVLDTVTGESRIVAKEKPLSLFGFPSDVEAMVRYGLTTRGGQGAELAARWQFLRIGAFRLGAYGEISSQPEAKGMLEVAYKF